MWSVGCTVFEACKGGLWSVDWSQAPTPAEVDRLVQGELRGLHVTDPWINAVLQHTLRG